MRHWLTCRWFAVFTCPRRPNLGREGRPIVLRANHFQISMPRGFVHHYEVTIQPDKCPRKVNREIIETMVHAYSRIFGNLRPVFDGRNNLYTKDPLPIGNDKLDLEVGSSDIIILIYRLPFWLYYLYMYFVHLLVVLYNFRFIYRLHCQEKAKIVCSE